MLLSGQYPSAVRRNFYYDLASGLFFGLYFGGVNNFILVQARRLGASPFWVSFLAALPCIWMICSPLWVTLFGEKNPFQGILVFDGLSRLSLVFLLFSSSPGWYMIVFCFHYLLSSVSATIYGKAMRLAYPTGARGQLMGLVRIGVSLTAIASASLAGILLPIWGVQRFFAFSAFFGVLSALSFGQLKPVGSETLLEKTLASSSSFRILRDDPDFCNFMISLFLVGFGNWVATPIYVVYQVDVLKVRDGFISVMAIITSLSALVSYYVWGRHTDRHPPLVLSSWIFFFNLFIPFIYFLARSSWPLLLIAFIQGLLNAGGDIVTLNNVISFAGEENISSYMGVHIALLGLRGTIGPFLGPLLLPVLGLKGLFLLAFLLMVSGLLLNLLRLRPSDYLVLRRKS